MNISLPDALKSLVDEQVATLRQLLLDGAASPVTTIADETYFNGLRQQLDEAKTIRLEE